VDAQPFAKFFIEWAAEVMLFLVENVSIYRIELGLAYREHGVALLPTKAGEIRKRLMNPPRRMRFEVLHRHGDGRIRSPANQQIHMVGHSVDLERNSAFAANDSAEVFVHTQRKCGFER